MAAGVPLAEDAAEAAVEDGAEAGGEVKEGGLERDRAEEGDMGGVNRRAPWF